MSAPSHSSEATPTRPLVEGFFRHEYGRLVATLTRRVGVRHLERVEDAAQSALLTALQRWTVAGVPTHPSAWLYRVAQNRLLDELRGGTRRHRILGRVAAETSRASDPEAEAALAGEMQDDLLRMLFVCCDDSLPPTSQIVLALKTSCGFDVREIALRLFTSEANVYKRLQRARSRLRDVGPGVLVLDSEQYVTRLAAVHRVLYLLFTEGHLSCQPEAAIRHDLCREAIRLTTVLIHHPSGRTPATLALLALMHLHAARLASRHDARGALLLLEQQDRRQWDPAEIELGLEYLAESAQGDHFSPYHAEAAIAAEHCLAPTLADTRWSEIARYYARLERMQASPVHRLNRAVATAEWQGAAAGLAVLDEFEPPKWLADSYLWSAVRADLYRRLGDSEQAERHRAAARSRAPNQAVRQLLDRRLGAEGE